MRRKFHQQTPVVVGGGSREGMWNLCGTLSHGSDPGQGSEDGECAEYDQQSLLNSGGEKCILEGPAQVFLQKSQVLRTLAMGINILIGHQSD